MSTTRVMVLGLLLQYGAMSGYEIQQKMQSAQTDKWAYVQPASIYHALKKLDSEGIVRLETLEQTGNRSKAIYAITEAGKSEFSRLLIESFKETSVVFPTALYTALTFMDEAGLHEIEEALSFQHQAIEKIYKEMKLGQEQKAELMDIPVNVMLIFKNIYDQCELQLKFVKQIKEEIRRNS
ncbi:PadR family transcriptional regulator [Paenibacillus polymyxa]|uniref:PadR family transcriptional regulator n=1 Tax=Paenibacillus TaxID=44249 RepID=UPI0003678293|nr:MULTISPECIES: PadR family transcriptional regulator [Paenibacillus]KAE8559177.1 PadR family transcriptional regulator [Paenibacillus polymyxa]KAF6619431.1 PadR family transcriptional regulator [Paenibacillus sp. EKM101P]KAF6624523.1 PadR family transcriptional regulator [Paenibacillus sp. EKM102P]KAF6635699.1 PadR family transcriptional regulator [Paenibacillus sp. EKM10P]KAF6648593.1 PadR family transcriptional regulator [Paenibacillus sp. EKM11P]